MGGHTVLLRSDGTAVAFGDNEDGQCDLKALNEGLAYTTPSSPSCLLPTLILQACFDGASLSLVTLSGEEFCRVSSASADNIGAICSQALADRFAGTLGSEFARVDVVLPGGELLNDS